MKTKMALTLVLALALLMAPLLVARPAHAQTVTFNVYPIAVAPLTDSDASLYVLETPASPSPAGQFFNVEVHLLGATVADVPNGVAGVEIVFNFTDILPYAIPISFTNELGTAGGALNSPLLYGINPGFYDNAGNVVAAPYTTATNYHVAAASTGGAWNGADGLVVIIQFQITGQPNQLLSQPDFIQPLPLTFASAVDGTAAEIPTGVNNGTLHIDSAPPVYPPRAKIFIDPPTFTGGTTLGQTFNLTVMIGNEFDTLAGVDGFWDVAGYDVTVSWDPTLITLVAYSEGGFLHQGGVDTFGFYNVAPGSIQAVFTKLSDPTPSSGIDSLVQLQFAVAFVGTSFPAPSTVVALGPTDLASWAHPERTFGPWFGSITAVDLPYDPNPSIQEGGTALDWTHVRANGFYQASYVAAGAAIDLYDQYPDPFGGQGPNQHSDSFAPQQLVCLYAKVTYGGDRVTNKLVVFEVHNAAGEKITILQNYSDINGIATVCFRIPQTDLIPGGEDPAIFGIWNITANVELDGIVVTDTMTFLVGWFAQVTSVDAVGAPYAKYTDQMNFTAHLLVQHEQPIMVLVSVDSYDAQGYPIGETAFFVTVNAIRGPDATIPVTFDYPNLMQAIPTWARVGTASVIGYALTDFPRNGGTPWGPQSPATLFTISLT